MRENLRQAIGFDQQIGDLHRANAGEEQVARRLDLRVRRPRLEPADDKALPEGTENTLSDLALPGQRPTILQTRPSSELWPRSCVCYISRVQQTRKEGRV